MDKKEVAREIMQIVRTDLASARDSLHQGEPSWRTIDAAMSKLRRIASILDYGDREPPKAAN